MSQPAATVGTEPAKGNGGDLVVWSWTRRPFGLACSLYLWLLLSAGPAAASHTLAPIPLSVFSSLTSTVNIQRTLRLQTALKLCTHVKQ